MEISNFLRKRKPLPTLPDNYKENAEWEEERFFNAWIKKYPVEEHSDIEEHIRYIRKYVLRYPDFDGEEYSPSWYAFTYYNFREERIKQCRLSESEFFQFDILQSCISDLGLSPKATFDFIIFLWHELFKWLHYGSEERTGDKIFQIIERIKEHPDDRLELDIKVGKKHFTFFNEDFIKSIIANFTASDLEASNLIEKSYPLKREIDYILIKTLLDNLPITYKKEKKGAYSQSERTLGLCVLWLTGEIDHLKGDSPNIICSKFNNATFDKLMRDYKDLPLPAVLPLM